MSSAVTDGGLVVGTSVWRASNPPPPAANPLSGRISADVLIVGAGIAGLSLGVHLRAKNIEIAILEADNDAAAATSASAGIIAPQLVRTTPNGVLKRLGADVGARALRLIGESGRYTFALIDELGIACDARQSGFLNPVAGRHATNGHAKLIEEWRPFRDDLRLIDAAEVRALSGCRGYSAAILDPTGGGLDPLAYSRGLARILRAKETRLHYNSRVLSLARSAEGWVATTRGGAVTARRVVLCANGGNSLLHRALAQTVLPLSVCEVATQPLPVSMRETILPYGHTLTDSSADVFSIRFDEAHRLITACPGGSGLDRAHTSHLINRRLMQMIPDYSSTPLEYIWQGTAWLNSSLLPRVLRVDDGLMAVQACNGRGIALNTIIGRELGAWMADPKRGELMVPMETPKRVAGFFFARYLPGIMMSGEALAKRTLQRFSWRR